MLRLFLMGIVLLTATVTVADSTSPASDSTLWFIHRSPHVESHLLQSLGLRKSSQSTAYSAACCKNCTVGKACGNTCISRADICHVGPGCACDG
jgi:hypothetical protein